MHATVIGAGVSGLTTATALADAGWTVSIVADQHFNDTVSTVAAAIWTMTAAEPQVKARRWALTCRDRLVELAKNPNSGVSPLRQREYERVDPGPTWWETTPYVQRIPVEDLPPGYPAGFEIDGFIFEPPKYLGWLTDRLAECGTVVRREHVDAVTDLAGDMIVNCAGLAARELVGDVSLFPIRGQVVAVSQSGIHDGVADESDVDRVSYVYPRSSEVILGGARQTGVTDLAPDPEMTDRILADAATLDPRVAGSTVLDVRVGLRPGRPQVRLEVERLHDGRPVVHNYGHGGAGFLLSWGCASEVVELAAQATGGR